MYCLALRNEGASPASPIRNSVKVRTLSWKLLPADNLVSALKTSKPAQCLQMLNNWMGLYISNWKFTGRLLSPKCDNVPSVHMLESFSKSLRYQSLAKQGAGLFCECPELGTSAEHPQHTRPCSTCFACIKINSCHESLSQVQDYHLCL